MGDDRPMAEMEQTSRPDLRAGIAVTLTVLMWASSFVIMRGAAPFLSPGPLTLLRLAAATLALGVLLAVLIATGRIRLRPVGRRALVLLVLYGVSWFAVYTIVLAFATRHLDAGTSAMLVNLAPILVAAAAGLLFGEGWPRSLFVGMGVALGGVVLISVAGGVGQVSMLGVCLALLAAVLYAGGMLLQRWVLDEVDPLTTVFAGCASGTLVCLPYLGQLGTELPDAPVSAVAGAVFMGVGATAAGFSLWAFAQTRMRTGRLAASSLAVPAVALLLSAVFLAEVPPVLAVVGGVLCLIGVGITRFAPRRPTVPRPGPSTGRRTAPPDAGSAHRRGRRAGSGMTSRRRG